MCKLLSFCLVSWLVGWLSFNAPFLGAEKQVQGVRGLGREGTCGQCPSEALELIHPSDKLVGPEDGREGPFAAAAVKHQRQQHPRARLERCLLCVDRQEESRLHPQTEPPELGA